MCHLFIVKLRVNKKLRQGQTNQVLFTQDLFANDIIKKTLDHRSEINSHYLLSLFFNLNNEFFIDK